MKYVKKGKRKAMKDQYIKLRVTKQEKEKLMQLAAKEKQTLSCYLLHKGLTGTDGTGSILLSEKIEISDFLNEIYHNIQKSCDEKLKTEIQALCLKNMDRIWGQNSESRINGKIHQ